MLVTAKDGLRGKIQQESSSVFPGRTLVEFDNGQQVYVPNSTLQPQEDGSYYLPLGLSDLDNKPIVVPVIEEQAEFSKQEITSGLVRINKVVHEREEVVDEPLITEEVEIERVPINKVVKGQAPKARQDGDKTIIPVLEEVLVVEKRLLLKEELRITRRKRTFHDPQVLTLRSEEVTVERTKPDDDTADAAS
jgi:uncharacterized protein (TIGR02271 family)